MRRLLLLILLLLGGNARVQAEPLPEHDVKATYLYNFAVLTRWPESARARFNICTLGAEEVGLALRKLEGKLIHERPLTVARLSTLAAIRECQVLFVGQQDAASLPRIVATLGDEPVMTVTDAPQLASVCVVVAPEGKRLAFDVNLEKCRAAHLRPGAPMLNLARTVLKPEP